MKGRNQLVNRLTALCFTASSAVHALGVCLQFVSSRQQFSSISHLFSVTISEQCGNVMMPYTLEQLIFRYHTYVKYGYVRKCRRKFRRKFNDERVAR
jgi:hypothetical protein